MWLEIPWISIHMGKNEIIGWPVKHYKIMSSYGVNSSKTINCMNGEDK